MPIAVRNISTWLVLLVQAALLLAPLAITLVKHEVHRSVRNQVLASITPTDCEHLTLSLASFQQCLRDDGKELEINGVMHDIVRTTQVNDVILVVCVQDNAETALKNIIRLRRSDAMQRDARGVALLSALMSTLTPTVLPNRWIETDPPCVSNTFSCEVNERVLYVPRAPDTPPPERMI
ncbi:MAG: hypothetical protein IPP80_05910 [Ignavibacteria bacterium]|nr:hypothetical protein [Ignavibacteria bacterium]